MENLIWISVLFLGFFNILLFFTCLTFYFRKVSAAYFRKDFSTFLKNDGQRRLLGLTIEILWLSAGYKISLGAYVI